MLILYPQIIWQIFEKSLSKSWQIFGEKLFMSTFICWDVGWETYYASLIVIYDPLIFLHRKEIAWDTKSNFRNHEASLSSLTFDKRRKTFLEVYNVWSKKKFTFSIFIQCFCVNKYIFLCWMYLMCIREYTYPYELINDSSLACYTLLFSNGNVLVKLIILYFHVVLMVLSWIDCSFEVF